eukprot:jgi/Botrbrau1/22094/Bobra.0206s0020.1
MAANTAGPSGAGKSSLLDILAMRIKQTSGEVLVDGVARDSTFGSISTYIPQDDTFIPTLTTWETLWFYSRLRLHPHIERQYREDTMAQILKEMGLEKTRNTQVGGLLPGGLYVRGISGGERKRLNIACGIIAAPSIIFLDEPTSGLDSHASLVLLEYLKNLAQMGRTLVCSIHQPRVAIWDLFDKVEVLSEGYLLYFGTTKGAVAWFSDFLGLRYDPSTDGTFSDWLLDSINISFGASEGHSVVGLQSLQDVSAAAKQFSDQGLPDPGKARLGMEPASSRGGLELHQERSVVRGSLRQIWMSRAYPTPLLNQLSCLLWRALMAYIRNPADMAGRLVLGTSTGIICGLTFLNANPDGKGVLPVVFLMYYVILLVMVNPFAQLTMYVADRTFYVADVAANLYSPFAYFVAQTVSAMPFNILTGLSHFFTTYGLVGLSRQAGPILVSTCAIGLFALSCVQVLIFSGYAMPNQDLALVLATFYVTVGLLVVGYPIPLKNLVGILRGISYVTNARYVMQILVRQQFMGTTREPMLERLNMVVPTGFNFLGMILIYIGLLAATYLALMLLAVRVRR